jgi:putative ABC transport system permease protein
MNKLPPRLLMNFFRWYCHPRLVNHIEGDLIEVYRRRLKKTSRKVADLRFLMDVLLLLRPGIIRPARFRTLNQFGMYKNYLTITFRVFNRERLYSLINISGLAMGFTCCMLIYLFVRDELRYDKFHQDADRIYRISAAYMRQGQWEPYASNSWKTGELIKSNYSQIETLVKFMPDDGVLFEAGGKKIIEDHLVWADDNFFSLFNFPLKQGKSTDALKGMNKVVISESTAAKYFGNEDAIGKVFMIEGGQAELQVSGIMHDMPSNSHFHYDFVISGETLKQVVPEGLFTNVGWDSQYIYVKLEPEADPRKIEATFPDFVNKNLEFLKSDNFMMFMQPLLSIHLQSNIGRELEVNGSLNYVYIFSVIALFILAIACVNYMNLTTARSMRRAKEVGMRKVFGAKRPDLFGQFLTESFITTGIAIVLALLLSSLLLPSFNDFSGKHIPQPILFTPRMIEILFGALIVIGFVAGLYPALVLSSFKPLNSMKTAFGAGKSAFNFRKGLVLLQFVISIGLMAASAIVFNQWNFLRTKSLGINQEMVLSVPLQTMDRKQLEAFTQQVENDPSIIKTGFSNMRMPGWIGNSTSYTAQDIEANKEVNKSMKIIRIDFDFFPTIEASIIEGRNFSRDFPSDSLAVIINESAVSQLNWKDPVGKWMEFNGKRFTVVGLVKDFHFESLHRKIPPTIFLYSGRSVNYMYAKIDGKHIPATIDHIKKTYSRFVTDRDFTFTFLNEDIAHQYEGEEKFAKVFSIFTGLAIVIACLGTFGLISFTAERKSKEIGIRKVLGASVGNVSFLLIKEFVILLLVASAIAWPITWYFLEVWIDDFVYRTSINAMPFILATLLAALIVVATTGFRAIRAALANPVDSLRNE